MKSILLINPPPAHPISRTVFGLLGAVHLGLAYIGGALKRNGYDVRVVDMQAAGKGREYLCKCLSEVKPGMVGITATTESSSNAMRVADLMAELVPDAKVVVGGVHATLSPEYFLKNPAVDIVVRGEGDITVVELADHIMKGAGRLDAIRGLTFRGDNGAIINTDDRPLITDLDSLPYPARELFMDDKYPVQATLVSSRGCPGKCIFCAAGTVSGGQYRMRSAENVVGEFQHLEESGHVFVGVADDTMTVDNKRLLTICRLLEERNVNLLWTCESRVDQITREALEWMHRTGCLAVQFGVESGVNEVLRSMGKGVTVEQVEAAVKMARDVGMDVTCSFIIGTPSDTPVTVEKSIAFMSYLQKKYEVRALPAIAVPYPGTKMMERAEELGLTILSKDYDMYYTMNPVFSSKYLTSEQLKNYHYDSIIEIKRSLSPKALDYYYKTASRTGLVSQMMGSEQKLVVEAGGLEN